MHIVMFSITPLLPDRVMGGAQKHLQSVALHLGESGHTVNILCTRQNADHAPFRWHDNVLVEPILRFKQPFPGPYETPAYNIAAVIQDLGERLQRADRFYLHDGEMIFPYVYQHTPTVVSLRDCVYPETWQGAFHFQGDALILISQYTADYFTGTVGRFFPDAAERIHVIHNGLDWDHFQPTPPGQILDYLPVTPGEHALILHPHRPERSKGLPQTIAVVDRLVHEYKLTHVRVLVPRWIDAALSPSDREFTDAMLAEIHRRGLDDYFIFHDWIPQALMPEYLSLGAVMFSLGHFVETFGNAVYEALGCGTPAIAARVSAHRELLPDDLLDKVDFDDVEAAAAIAAEIIRSGRRTSAPTLDALHARFSRSRMVAAYADVILNAQKLPPLPYRLTPITAMTRFALAPWCFFAGRGLYHDFRADYADLPALRGLTAAYPDGFTLAEAGAAGVDAADVMAWYRDGYLMPKGSALESG